MHISIIDQNQDITDLLIDFILESEHEGSSSSSMVLGVLNIYTLNPNLVIIDPLVSENGHLLFSCAKDKGAKTCLMTTDKKLKNKVKADYYLDKPFNLIDLEKIIEDTKITIDS